jgi:hypothetical protein
MGGNIHLIIKCEGCKRKIGGCHCVGEKTTRWIDKATCYHCRFEEEDAVSNRFVKKSRGSKDSKPVKKRGIWGV